MTERMLKNCIEKLDAIAAQRKVQAVEKEKLDKILEPVNILAVGYSDEEAADPERHTEMRIPISQLVSYEKL